MTSLDVSKYWEQSLNDIVSITDENLQRLADERNRNVHSSHTIQSQSQSSLRPRAQSLTRSTGNILQPSKPLQNKQENVITQKVESDMDRKLDLLFRKTKLLHEKIKKFEKDSSDANNGLIESHKEISILKESQKTDKKIINTMKDQISTLKTELDMINTKEGIRDRVSRSESLQLSNSDNLDEYKSSIVLTIKDELYRDVRDWSRSFLNEQMEGISKYVDKRVNEEKRHSSHHHLSSTSSAGCLTEPEKEIIKMKADFERIKLRQSSLDSIYSELRDSVQHREKEAEDRHRRAISNHKLEINALNESVGRKVNDFILMMEKAFQNFDLPELKRQSNENSMKLDALFKEAFDKLFALEDTTRNNSDDIQYILSENFVVNLFGDNEAKGDIDDDVKHQREMSGMENMNEGQGDDDDASSPRNLFRNWRMKVQSIHENHNARIDESEQIITGQKIAIHDSELKMQVLESQITAYNEEFRGTVDMLIEAGKKTRRKVNDVSSALSDFSALGSNVEEILNHINTRSKDDASWTFQFTSSVSKLESRMMTCETQLDSVVKQPNSYETKAENTFKSLFKRLESLEDNSLYGHPSSLHQLYSSESKSIFGDNSNGNNYAEAAMDSRIMEFRHDIADQMEALVLDINAQCMNMIQSHMSFLNENFRSLQSSVAEIRNYNSLAPAIAIDIDGLKRNYDSEIHRIDGRIHELEAHVTKSKYITPSLAASATAKYSTADQKGNTSIGQTQSDNARTRGHENTAVDLGFISNTNTRQSRDNYSKTQPPIQPAQRNLEALEVKSFSARASSSPIDDFADEYASARTRTAPHAHAAADPRDYRNSSVYAVSSLNQLLDSRDAYIVQESKENMSIPLSLNVDPNTYPDRDVEGDNMGSESNDDNSHSSIIYSNLLMKKRHHRQLFKTSIGVS